MHRSSILRCDPQLSVVASITEGAPHSFQYTPYGFMRRQPLATTIGYAGQLREKAFGWYMLGHGHRTYNPMLMRFHSPDHLSPFERGGINAYAYVSNDPINAIDPDGLTKQLWNAAASVGLGKASVGLLHNGIKTVKALSMDNPNLVTEVVGYGFKFLGEAVSAGASAIKLALNNRGMDPDYAAVDDSVSDLGLAATYLAGQVISTVGEGILTGVTLAGIYNRYFGGNNSEASREQGRENRGLLNNPPELNAQGAVGAERRMDAWRQTVD
ncbi:RHS repeat-associated core domain-containing protein [Pseudomonas mosselii]|uniref:RHS repeat-associated core domain-containing protein n=1 Tax=Pseudomonas mosselii TaxID=78327 RepID=A0AA42URX6_9PSED|nr:RHS repeat-associated core domain-containing protein [Pseudomonas mosselii]MDH1629005.1 RHS repeat-associated core domain-containing protein [Pseudomonas mosselii]MEA3237137.1 RHS repeat-associated core domain-containing protein [Pseudomonas mosselii]UWS67543.1 RHS repeat-associated core domain-containing protein [Pseudomonas mosselii]